MPSVCVCVCVSILNAVIRAADEGKVTCLVLLNLSASFDSVDHDILPRCFPSSPLGGRTCTSVVPYVAEGPDTDHYVDGKDSTPIPFMCSVPQ